MTGDGVAPASPEVVAQALAEVRATLAALPRRSRKEVPTFPTSELPPPLLPQGEVVAQALTALSALYRSLALLEAALIDLAPHLDALEAPSSLPQVTPITEGTTHA